MPAIVIYLGRAFIYNGQFKMKEVETEGRLYIIRGKQRCVIIRLSPRIIKILEYMGIQNSEKVRVVISKISRESEEAKHEEEP